MNKNILAVIGLIAVTLLLTGCNRIPGDLGTILQNLDRAYIPLLRLVVATSYVLGIWFTVAGIYRLKKYGQMRTMMMAQINFTGPLMMLLAGMVLFYLPTMIEISLETIWGNDSIMGYGAIAPNMMEYFLPIVHIVQLVGYFSFIRGWVQMARVGKEGAQPGGFGKAFMHIFGGILAINVMGVVSVIENTLL